MRRLLCLAALSMLMVALPASVALGQSRGPSGEDGSYNCPDFDTQIQAQSYYEDQGGLSGGDPDGLDRDQDGQACEDSLPAGSTPSETGGVPQDTGTQQQPQSSSAVSCDEFISAAGNPSQLQAQQFYDFEATAAQQAALDANGDGFACDSLETGVDNLGETDADRAAMQQPTTPGTEQATTEQYADSAGEMTTLPDTGGFPFAGIAAGAGALLVAGGLLLRRRLT